MQAPFALSPSTPLTLAGLLHPLESQAMKLQESVASMQVNLQAVQINAGLKCWLKAQKKR